MQIVKLSALRIVELTQIMDSIQPKDLSTVKDIRLNVSLVNDLTEACKELSSFVSDFNVKRNEALKPLQVEYLEKTKELKTDEEKKVVSTELDAKFAEANKEWIEADQKKMNEMGEAEVSVELSDEKHTKLKEWFLKYSIEKYLNKKVLLEVSTALGIEE